MSCALDGARNIFKEFENYVIINDTVTKLCAIIPAPLE